MADGPGTPLEKYFNLRTSYFERGIEWDSETMKTNVIIQFLNNGWREDDPRLEVVRMQPKEHRPMSPSRRAALKRLDREAMADLEQMKLEQESALLRQSAQAREVEELRKELLELRQQNLELAATAKTPTKQGGSPQRTTSDVPELSWTKTRMLAWAEARNLSIPEELAQLGTKADLVEYLLEHAGAEEE